MTLPVRSIALKLPSSTAWRRVNADGSEIRPSGVAWKILAAMRPAKRYDRAHPRSPLPGWGREGRSATRLYRRSPSTDSLEVR